MRGIFIRLFYRNIFQLYVLILAGFTWVLSVFPGHNGDMPFYIACAIEKDHGSMQGVVAETLTVLRTELPAKEYQDHARRITESDDMLLERYRIKPLYILLILSLHKIGFSWITSTILPSLACFFLIGLSVWQFASKRLRPIHCFLVSIVSVCIFPSLLLARLSTPDAISCFVLLNAFFLIYEGRNKNLWLSLFILAIVVRLDNVITELLLLLALYKWPVAAFANKLSTFVMAKFSAILVGTAVLINAASTHHFFWFLISHFPLPPGQYRHDLIQYFFVLPGSFFLYLSVVFILSGFANGYSWKLEANYIYYWVCLVVFIRFLLYPYYEERFFTPVLLFSLLTLSFQFERVKGREKGLAGGS